jgi:DNA repair protein RecN (Recombination protein N)
MPGASFAVEMDFDENRATRLGIDRVEFLFSANTGQSPRPLQKVASGGELSRILLAFKAVLAAADPVPTYIFDEIDAGVGGRTALAVGKLLSRLATGQQVLCITHTAQLAAFADQHIVVTKEEKRGETVTEVTTLNSPEARARELARMLSGLDDSATALDNARELLEAAAKEKRRV